MSYPNDIIELKMYFRYILYIDYALQKIYKKRNFLESQSQQNKRQRTEKDKNSILEYYFKDTLNENKLGNASDMHITGAFFKHLCYNSYDSTCNEYHNFINTLNKNNNQYNEKFADNLIQQFDDFSKKMHGLSLQEQQINQLKTLFANAGANNIDSERFKEITDFIQSKLTNYSQSKTNTQVDQLDEDIKKEEETINARKEEMQEIEKYKLDLFEKEETNIQKKEKEITDNNKNIDTIEKELEKYNKPNLTTQKKEDKTKLEYQIADLQSKKEKLNKEKEESIIKKQDLQKDYNETKNINDAERNQLENTLNGKKRKNEEEKDKVFFERGKVFFESLTPDLKTAEKIIHGITEDVLKDIKTNPNKLIEKINVDDIKSLTDLEKMRSTLRYLKSTDLTDDEMEKTKVEIGKIEEKIKNIKEEDAKEYGVITEEKDPEKEVINKFSNIINGDNIFEIILSLPISFLENKSKSEIVDFLSTQLGETPEEINKHLNFKNYISEQINFLNKHNDTGVYVDYDNDYNDLIKKIKSKKNVYNNLSNIKDTILNPDSSKFNSELNRILNGYKNSIIEIFGFFDQLIDFYNNISPTIGKFFTTLKTTIENSLTTISEYIALLKKGTGTAISSTIESGEILLERIRIFSDGLVYNINAARAGLWKLLTGEVDSTNPQLQDPQVQQLFEAINNLSREQKTMIESNNDKIKILDENMTTFLKSVEDIKRTIESKDTDIKDLRSKLETILSQLSNLNSTSSGVSFKNSPSSVGSPIGSDNGSNASSVGSPIGSDNGSNASSVGSNTSFTGLYELSDKYKYYINKSDQFDTEKIFIKLQIKEKNSSSKNYENEKYSHLISFSKEYLNKKFKELKQNQNFEKEKRKIINEYFELKSDKKHNLTDLTKKLNATELTFYNDIDKNYELFKIIKNLYSNLNGTKFPLENDKEKNEINEHVEKQNLQKQRILMEGGSPPSEQDAKPDTKPDGESGTDGKSGKKPDAKSRTEPDAKSRTEQDGESGTEPGTKKKSFDIVNKHLNANPTTNSKTIDSDILESNQVSLDEDQQKIFNQSTKIKKRGITMDSENAQITTNARSDENLNEKLSNTGDSIQKAIDDPWIKPGLLGVAGFSIVNNFYINDDGGQDMQNWVGDSFFGWLSPITNPTIAISDNIGDIFGSIGDFFTMGLFGFLPGLFLVRLSILLVDSFLKPNIDKIMTSNNEEDDISKLINLLKQENKNMSSKQYLLEIMIQLSFFKDISTKDLTSDEVKNYIKLLPLIERFLKLLDEESIENILLEYLVLYKLSLKTQDYKLDEKMIRSSCMKNVILYFFIITKDDKKKFKDFFLKKENNTKSIILLKEQLSKICSIQLGMITGLTINSSNELIRKMIIDINSANKIDDKINIIITNINDKLSENLSTLNLGFLKTVKKLIINQKNFIEQNKNSEKIKELDPNNDVIMSLIKQFNNKIVTPNILQNPNLKDKLTDTIISKISEYEVIQNNFDAITENSSKKLHIYEEKTDLINELQEIISREDFKHNNNLKNKISLFFEKNLNYFITSELNRNRDFSRYKPFIDLLDDLKIYLNSRDLNNNNIKNNLLDIINYKDFKLIKILLRNEIIKAITYIINKYNEKLDAKNTINKINNIPFIVKSEKNDETNNYYIITFKKANNDIIELIKASNESINKKISIYYRYTPLKNYSKNLEDHIKNLNKQEIDLNNDIIELKFPSISKQEEINIKDSTKRFTEKVYDGTQIFKQNYFINVSRDEHKDINYKNQLLPYNYIQIDDKYYLPEFDISNYYGDGEEFYDNEKHDKKFQEKIYVEGYNDDRNIMPYINAFINTNLTDTNPGFFNENKYASLGGKKRKRPKTIKKYKYKKNKTGKRKGKKGKKTNNTPKLMNAKKSHKKMTISQILINNLKK